jgi:hypothetical protein
MMFLRLHIVAAMCGEFFLTFFHGRHSMLLLSPINTRRITPMKAQAPSPVAGEVKHQNGPTWQVCRSALVDFADKMRVIHQGQIEANKPKTSRDLVRQFMSLLAPPNSSASLLSEDLQGFSRFMESIATAVGDEILTEEEADAVVRFIASRFTQRRMDEILSKVTTAKHGAWFLIRHHA